LIVDWVGSWEPEIGVGVGHGQGAAGVVMLGTGGLKETQKKRGERQMSRKINYRGKLVGKGEGTGMQKSAEI